MKTMIFLTTIIIGAVSSPAFAFEGFLTPNSGKALCAAKFGGSLESFQLRDLKARDELDQRVKACRNRSFTSDCEREARDSYNYITQVTANDRLNFSACAGAFHDKVEISESVFQLCYSTTTGDNRGYGAKVAACLSSLSGLKIETAAAKYCDAKREAAARRECYVAFSGQEFARCEKEPDPRACAKRLSETKPVEPGVELKECRAQLDQVRQALSNIPGITGFGRGQKHEIEALADAVSVGNYGNSAR